VPTVEPIYVEQIGSPNVCISGGRARLDYRFAKGVLVYGWAGTYASYSEINPANNTCEARDDKGVSTRTNTGDTGIGTELVFDQGRSHVFAWAGARSTDREQAPASDQKTFYREGYVRYDLLKHLTGPVSLQMQGFHRHRVQPQDYADPWNEGENYSALQWSPHYAAIFGYEYLNKSGCRPDPTVRLCHYFSGGLQWRAAEATTVWKQLFDTVNIFVGQRRGAIRCVSGVCRQFPPFEGARIEIVSRF
jgi:hypothetical protein